jgi:hypothetical protein
MRMRRQDLEHVYDGCELDDAETRAKVVEFLDRAMWCKQQITKVLHPTLVFLYPCIFCNMD